MLNFFDTVIRLCIFKAKPQDLPAHINWLFFAFALIVLATLIGGLDKEAGTELFTLSILQNGIYGFTIYLILKLKGFQSRWLQTLTALFATSFILQLLAIPFADDITLTEEKELLVTNSLLFIFLLSFWNLTIIAHILKNAMESSFFAAFFLGLFATIMALALAFSLLGSSPMVTAT